MIDVNACSCTGVLFVNDSRYIFVLALHVQQRSGCGTMQIQELQVHIFTHCVCLRQPRGGFHQPLGFKNTILRGSRGRPGEWWRPEYSSGDQYRIRVVQASLITQLKPARICPDHPTPTEQATHTGEG